MIKTTNIVDTTIRECDELAREMLDILDKRNPNAIVAVMALSQLLAGVLELLGPDMAVDTIPLIRHTLDKIEASFRREMAKPLPPQ